LVAACSQTSAPQSIGRSARPNSQCRTYLIFSRRTTLVLPTMVVIVVGSWVHPFHDDRQVQHVNRRNLVSRSALQFVFEPAYAQQSYRDISCRCQEASSYLFSPGGADRQNTALNCEHFISSISYLWYKSRDALNIATQRALGRSGTRGKMPSYLHQGVLPCFCARRPDPAAASCSF
jgi:hypothetical protein